MRTTIASPAARPQAIAPTIAALTSIAPGSYHSADDSTPATKADPTRNRTSMGGA